MNTYALIDGSWYLVVTQEDYELNEEFRHLVDFYDHYHAKTLQKRLFNQPDLLNIMMSKMDYMYDSVVKHGTLYVNKVGGFYPVTESTVIEQIIQADHRPYQDEEGLTGWLDTDGTFYEGIYGLHDLILDYFSLVQFGEGEAVYFSSDVDLFGEMFESVQGSDLTEAQRQWFVENMHALTLEQQRQAQELLDKGV